MTAGREFWTPEPIWAGQPAFVLASGPSLTRETAQRLRRRNVIAVNCTAELVPWAPVWFFTDNSVHRRHLPLIRSFAGIIVTVSRRAKALSPHVRRVRADWMPAFPPPGSEVIRQGRSSGQTAMSLAQALGASPVVALGLDMRFVGDREHHHVEYPDRVSRGPELYPLEFIPAFQGWRDQARAAGCRMLNATPGSALAEFPMVDLDDVLAEFPMVDLDGVLSCG